MKTTTAQPLAKTITRFQCRICSTRVNGSNEWGLLPEGYTCCGDQRFDILGHINYKTTRRTLRTACEGTCETSTAAACRCSCGGMNHGIRS